ncbi:unnamed protein product, partial [Allacma fusca]
LELRANVLKIVTFPSSHIMFSKRKPLVVGLLVLSVISLISISDGQRRSYGESCNKTLRCDRKSWLGCMAGTCDCVKQEEMIFEPSTKKCVSKAGERCKYAMEYSDGSKAIETANCVETAICGEDGYCLCNEDFYENTNGTCSLTGRHSESCDDQAKCSSSLGLICKDGICECDDKTSAYSEDDGQCIGLVGHTCVATKCTQDASCLSNKCVCKEGFFHNSKDQCSRKLDLLQACSDDGQCKSEGGLLYKCVDGVCACDPNVSMRFQNTVPRKSGLNFGGTCSCLPGYTRSSSGTCGVGYGQTCSTAGICLEGMVCNTKDGRCKCRYSTQVYDQSKQKCISPVRGPCDWKSLCKDGAECQNIKNSTQGTCACKPGYVEGASGSCDAEYGKPCTATISCDSLAGLTCLDYTCQCGDFQEFSQELQKCVGLVGSDCILGLKDHCVGNAECSRIRDGITKGSCRCSGGFEINANYTCSRTVADSLPVLEFPAVYDTETSEEGGSS